jgi:ADP-ribosyltransferase exoenzyme
MPFQNYNSIIETLMQSETAEFHTPGGKPHNQDKHGRRLWKTGKYKGQLRNPQRLKPGAFDDSEIVNNKYRKLLEQSNAKREAKNTTAVQAQNQKTKSRERNYKVFDAKNPSGSEKELSNVYKETFGRIKLTEDDSEAVAVYGSSSYKQINRALRSPDDKEFELDEEYAKAEQDLHKLLSDSYIPEDISVIRGAGGVGARIWQPLYAAGELKPGYVFRDKAYTSTSITNGWPGAQMVIKVPKGSDGLFLNAPGVKENVMYANEREVLLNKNAGFYVTNYTPKPQGGAADDEVMEAVYIGDYDRFVNEFDSNLDRYLNYLDTREIPERFRKTKDQIELENSSEKNETVSKPLKTIVPESLSGSKDWTAIYGDGENLTYNSYGNAEGYDADTISQFMISQFMSDFSESTEEVFNKEVTTEDFLRAIGAPNNSKYLLRKDNRGKGVRGELNYGFGITNFAVNATVGDKYFSYDNNFSFIDTGKRSTLEQRQAVRATQILAAMEAGATTINSKATRNPTVGSGTNLEETDLSYYENALLGYDTMINSYTRLSKPAYTALKKLDPTGYGKKETTSLQAIMKLPGGPEWWKKYGIAYTGSISDSDFDAVRKQISDLLTGTGNDKDKGKAGFSQLSKPTSPFIKILSQFCEPQQTDLYFASFHRPGGKSHDQSTHARKKKRKIQNKGRLKKVPKAKPKPKQGDNNTGLPSELTNNAQWKELYNNGNPKRTFEFTNSYSDSDSLGDSTEDIFGDGVRLTENDLADMVAAADGSTVSFTPKYGAITIHVAHPYYSQYRTLKKGDDGKPIIEQVSFFADEDSPKGIGTQIFATQVYNSKKAGIDRLEVSAGKSDPNPDFTNGMNGYYTWARFGYETELKDNLFEKLPDNLKTRSLNELMQKDGGAEWWKDNGGSFNGVFSLDDSSTSMKILRNYVKAKSKMKPDTSERYPKTEWEPFPYYVTPTQFVPQPSTNPVTWIYDSNGNRVAYEYDDGSEIPFSFFRFANE